MVTYQLESLENVVALGISCGHAYCKTLGAFCAWGIMTQAGWLVCLFQKPILYHYSVILLRSVWGGNNCVEGP